MKLFKKLAAGLSLLFWAFTATPSLAQVTVIDIIPASQSDENFNNTEPFVSVDPAAPLTIAASAFMTVSGPSTFGGLFVSYDGGNTWGINNILPSAVGAYNTGDITMHHTNSGNLYAGILLGGAGYEEWILRTTDPSLSTPMTSIWQGTYTQDQPHTDARTVLGWYDPGKERYWIGDHHLGLMDQSADSMDAAVASAATSVFDLDPTSPALGDHWECRTRSAADGRVYAAYYRLLSSISGGQNRNVMVVRDDNWGNSATPFQSLNGANGVTVAASVPVSQDTSGGNGHEWICGDLYLAVNPNDSANVYLAWSDAVGSANTLHLQQSTNAGVTWQPDMLTINEARNGAVAVNSQGKVAFLYQQLVGTSPNWHWETHLRRLSGGTWDDTTLATFNVDGTNHYFSGQNRILGDYLGLVAAGKNFYGIFSSDNDPTNSTFPAGVSFLRNMTAPGVSPATLLGNDGVTPVTPSTDPFFFRTSEINPASDFYVRDWTDSPVSFDAGLEPSTHADFYSTSDVWNMRTDGPTAFNANNQPQYDDPQPMSLGPNYAFARVSRNVGGTSESVTVDFLYSDGGVGVNYVDAGSTVISFASSVTQQTLPNGVVWTLPSGASNHVCLAAQISTANDPLIQPGLAGHSPGWPNTDLWVINDNNKAQRNMQVFGLGSAGGSGAAYFIAHNQATQVRDMQVGVAVDPALYRSLKPAPVLSILGSAQPQTLTLKSSHDIITLKGMAPGENRWIEVSFHVVAGQKAVSVPVRFYELEKGVPVNGYAVDLRTLPVEEQIKRTLLQHAVVFNRLAETFPDVAAKDQALTAAKLARKTGIAEGDYRDFVKTNLAGIQGIVAGMTGKLKENEPFKLAIAQKKLELPTAGLNEALNDHLSLLNKLDALATMAQKEQGDTADILQMVQWGIETFRETPAFQGKAFTADILRKSEAFVRSFQARKAKDGDYPDLIKGLLPGLREAAAELPGGKDGLESALGELGQNSGSPKALEKAYRDYLLKLSDLTGSQDKTVASK